MRRLIICADGTWNRPDEETDGVETPTNVVKLARALLPVDTNGVSQIAYYHAGVGTHDKSDRLFGGAFGKGLAFQDGNKSAWDRMVAAFPEVARGSTCKYQVWEVVDPEKWVPDGYACLRIDARGRSYDFYYGTKPGEWIALAKDADGTILSTKVAGGFSSGFVGTTIGMYATSPAPRP